ncbi:efflux RND transporter periplasmic adaptor subunit [bacterium]|nr:efflux RND transporter periplasmic adaptor subunit [bacterium]
MAEKKTQTAVKKRKKKRIILFAILGALVAIILINVLASGEPEAEVNIEAVERRTLESIVSGPGHIRPAIEVDLVALTAGQITQVAVTEGQQVRAGDLILEIDPDQSQSMLSQSRANYSAAQAQLDLAKANLTQAEDNFDRQQTLYDDGLISDQEWETAQTQLQVVRAQHESARSRSWGALASIRAARDSVDKTVYSSPMDGVIVALNFEQGDIAYPPTFNIVPLATIASLEGMKVEAEIDETDVILVEINLPAVVEIEALPRQRFAGYVSEIARSAKTSLSGTQTEVVNFEIKVVITDELPLTVLPGMSATVEITTDTASNALSIPISAVVVRDTETVQEWLGDDFTPADDWDEVEGVFVLEDETVSFRPVITGIADEAYIEILEGLEEGEEVVSGPYKELRELEHGSGVTIAEVDDEEE